MKRILSFLAAVGLVSTSASLVTACSNKANVVKKEDAKQKDKVEDPRITKLRNQYDKNNEDLVRIENLLEEIEQRESENKNLLDGLEDNMILKKANKALLADSWNADSSSIAEYEKQVKELEEMLVIESAAIEDYKVKLIEVENKLTELDNYEAETRAYIVKNGTPNKRMDVQRQAIIERHKHFKKRAKNSSEYLEKVSDELIKATREKEIFRSTVEGIWNGVKANESKNEELFNNYEKKKKAILGKIGEINAYQNMLSMEDQFPKEQVEMFERELKKAKDKLRDLEEEIHPIELEVAKEKAVSDALKADFYEKLAQLDPYIQKEEYFKKQKSITENQLKIFDNYASTLKLGIEKSNEVIDQYKFVDDEETKTDIKNMRDELIKIEVQRANLELEKSNYRMGDLDSRKRIEQAKAKLIDYKNKIDNLKQSLPDTQNKIDKADYECIMLTNQINEIKAEVETIKAMKAQALDHRDELLARNEDIKFEINYLSK